MRWGERGGVRERVRVRERMLYISPTGEMEETWYRSLAKKVAVTVSSVSGKDVENIDRKGRGQAV